MCVAYPMQVSSVENDRATVTMGETQTVVSIELLDDVSVGDYLIVHAGFAIQKLSVAEAEETIRLFEELAAIEGVGGSDP